MHISYPKEDHSKAILTVKGQLRGHHGKLKSEQSTTLSLSICVYINDLSNFSMRFNSIQGNKKTNKQEEILCLFVQEKKKYADQYKSSLVYI